MAGGVSVFAGEEEGVGGGNGAVGAGVERACGDVAVGSGEEGICCQSWVKQRMSWRLISSGDREKMGARVSQARWASCSAVRSAKAAERGPPIQPVRVWLRAGRGVHQTGGLEAKAKRKLKSPGVCA